MVTPDFFHQTLAICQEREIQKIITYVLYKVFEPEGILKSVMNYVHS